MSSNQNKICPYCGHEIDSIGECWCSKIEAERGIALDQLDELDKMEALNEMESEG